MVVASHASDISLINEVLLKREKLKILRVTTKEFLSKGIVECTVLIEKHECRLSAGRFEENDDGIYLLPKVTCLCHFSNC